MIVRLTHPHQFAIKARVPAMYWEAITQNRTPYGRRQHEVSLPPVAWRYISERLRAHAYGPMGGKTNGSNALYTAIARVQEAVNRIETHPAMKVNGAILGRCGDVIPAWTTDEGYTPYPSDGSFVILEPIPVEFDGHLVTRWHPKDPSGREPELLQESFHLRFCVEVG